MDWEHLPPHVLEKILYFAADHTKKENLWLISIEKFGRVCSYWKAVILSSKTLFPLDKSCLYLSHEKDEKFDAEAVDRLLETGFFSVVKTLAITDLKILKSKDPNRYVRPVFTNNSLIKLYCQIDAKETWTFQEECVLLKHFISNLAQVEFFCTRFKSIIKPHYAGLFWDLMIKMIHSNSKPKTLQFHIYGVDPQVNWIEYTNFNCSGPGSIKTLLFEFEQHFTIEDKSFPEWSHLTKYIKVEEVMVLQHGNIQFVYKIQADCFKIWSSVAVRFTDLGPAGPLALSNLEKTPIPLWFRSFKKFVLVDESPELVNQNKQRILRFFRDLGCRNVSFEQYPESVLHPWQVMKL